MSKANIAAIGRVHKALQAMPKTQTPFIITLEFFKRQCYRLYGQHPFIVLGDKGISKNEKDALMGYSQQLANRYYRLYGKV